MEQLDEINPSSYRQLYQANKSGPFCQRLNGIHPIQHWQLNSALILKLSGKQLDRVYSIKHWQLEEACSPLSLPPYYSVPPGS
ncbi:unnamed protein product [Closterium sp. Yama58-4]|nr:unnamed protein product [Closterium sp. Yama58-4]